MHDPLSGIYTHFSCRGIILELSNMICNKITRWGGRSSHLGWLHLQLVSLHLLLNVRMSKRDHVSRPMASEFVFELPLNLIWLVKYGCPGPWRGTAEADPTPTCSMEIQRSGT